MEKSDPLTIKEFTVDGRIYGIPRYHYGEIDQPWFLWIRQDWYEAADSPEIKTVEDFEELAKMFRRNHGEYGLAVDADLQWLLRTAPMFGAYVGDLTENNYFWRRDVSGRYKPGFAFPEFITALEYWAKWYKEGIISKDFFKLDADEEILEGNVGIQCYGNDWGWVYSDIIEKQESDKAIFLPFNLPSLRGIKPAFAQSDYGNQGVIVASKNFKNPDALMKVLSLVDHMLIDSDAGLTDEQITYFMEDGRDSAMTATFRAINPKTHLIEYDYVWNARGTADTSRLFTPGMKSKYDEILSWLIDRNPSGLGAYLQQGHKYSAYARARYLFENNMIVRNRLWHSKPYEFDQVEDIGGMIIEEITQIIIGRKTPEYFEEVLDLWYKQGGKILEDAVNRVNG